MIKPSLIGPPILLMESSYALLTGMAHVRLHGRREESMKGIVFNLLEEVVRRHHGEDMWDDILDRAGGSASFTSLGNYPDAEMYRLVGAASEILKVSSSEALRWFGRKAMPLLAEKYSAFFSPHHSSRSFTLSVNKFIHPEVRKLYTGADCPYFDFRENDDGSVEMTYRSARKMCALAQGFVEGAADHYGESVEFQHLECVHHGHAKCLFRIAWGEQPKLECVAA